MRGWLIILALLIVAAFFWKWPQRADFSDAASPSVSVDSLNAEPGLPAQHPSDPTNAVRQSPDTAAIDKLLDHEAGEVLSISDYRSGSRLDAIVERVWMHEQKHRISGRMTFPAAGSFVIEKSGSQWIGIALSPDNNMAYRIQTARPDNFVITEHVLSDLICARPRQGEGAVAGSVAFGLPRSTNQVLQAPQSVKPPAPWAIPILRSRPSASAVIYLDFDGEVVNEIWWNAGNTINAAPSGMTDAQITAVWRRVVEDYEMFDVNVTTLLSDYDSATVGRRTHCVITPTDTAGPGAGGIAYVDSFESGARYCWVFNTVLTKDCAEAIAHEVGHTLGLNHDGRTSPAEEYYAGHGSGETGWAPIMGVGYYQQLVQWSRGEYLSANRFEDDLAIITGKVSYIADDHAGVTNGATAINGSSITGIIEQRSDIDVFRVSLTAGTYTITLRPDQYGNLDGLLEVLNSSGTLMATSNPPDLISASNVLTVASSNVYYLRVRASGKGDVLGTGYSSYGSIGGYTLSGFGNQQQAPSAPIGLEIRTVSATQLELSWQGVSGASTYHLIRNGTQVAQTFSNVFTDTGLMPSTVYTYTVRAVNAFGTSTVSSAVGMTTPAMDEFVMDGDADFPTYTLANPGMIIRAAIRGNRLYVSTWSPGSNYTGYGNDHHIFISDQLLGSATTPAPWAKRGLIAIPGNKPYLAGEYTSTYAGWANTTGPVTLYKSSSPSGQLEGSMDLVQTFGSIPATLYIAVIAYQSDDSSVFDAALGRINAQAPSAVIPNDNIEPQEFLAIPTASIRDSGADGFYDVLSPSRSFQINSAVQPQAGIAFNWAAVPGISYSVYRSSNLLGDSWALVSVFNAGTTNWNGAYTETNPVLPGNYYQIRW